MNEAIVEKVKMTLIKAASCFRADQKAAYQNAIKQETNLQSRWVLETILENSAVSEDRYSPLCDDTGIPHLILEVGAGKNINGDLFNDVHKGIEEGLRALPGRPMAVLGDDLQRIDQSVGLSSDSGALLAAPIQVKPVDEDVIRLHIIMTGGGPEIRGKTYRVFHKHDTAVVIDEIVRWANDELSNLGCTPCTVAVGVGRSHFEAASMMVQAMAYGRYDVQSNIEREITRKINESNVGALGLGGDITALATFLKVGPQRASGVRIVSLRLCCCFEPRVCSIEL